MLAVSLDERKIDAVFEGLSGLPGAAIGICIGGTPVYRKGFGLANLELPVTLSPAIRMRIASISKHFTALAYLLLCEEGKARIDDPIGAYLPELNPVTHRVTLRQLMGHLGGLRDVHDLCWQFSGRAAAVSSAELLALYRGIDDVNASPGTAWSYNNGGYLMLSAAIERIAQQPLEDVMRERIFDPLGMHDSMLRRTDTDFVSNSAALHMNAGAGRFEKSSLGTAIAGEGGIVSTVDDMLRWLVHVDAPVVGSAATWEAIKSSQTLANGVSTGYGFGLWNSDYRGVATLSHAGGVFGGNAQMIKVPAAGLDIVIMVNRHDVSAVTLANQVLDACLPGLQPVIDSECAAPAAEGVFRSPFTGRVIQLLELGGQQIVSIDGADTPFVCGTDGVLRQPPVKNYVKQSVELIGDKKHPGSIRFHDFGNVDELTAMRPAVRATASSIEGRYRCTSTGIELLIERMDDGASLKTFGHFGSASYRMECLAEGVWRASPMLWGGVLTFADDNTSLQFSTGRTAALKFRRLE